ncbi:hypothetical protein [Roseovarius sp.]|uniref:hypothetical protein n=1 Tax=Roseovarius sp. TaxID=1486281 RepID=UPI003A979EB9
MNALFLLAALIAVLSGWRLGYRKKYRRAAILVGGAAACLAATFLLVEVLRFPDATLIMAVVAFSSLGVLLGSVIGVSLGWLATTLKERLRG